MTFPTIQTADTKSGTVTSNSGTWTLTYPTNLASGDLILAVVASDGNTGMTSTGFSRYNHGQAAVSLGVLAKISNGTETGTFTVSLNSEQGGWRVFRITGWYGGTFVADGDFTAQKDSDGISVLGVEGISANPDPPNLDPANWATEDTLWLAICAADTSRTISVYPYATNNTADVSGGANGATLGVCTTTSAVSALNPGTYTISASDDWVAATIAIRPAVPPTTGSGTASVSFTAAGTTQAEKVASGAVSMSMTAAATSKADKVASGAATLSITASGGGKADIIGHGTPTFSFTASAIGAAVITGSGASSVSFSASAVGCADITASGSSTVSFSAAWTEIVFAISDAGGDWGDTTTWVAGVVPTSADNVVATATSGNIVIDVSGDKYCRSLDLTSYTGTLSGNGRLIIGDSTAGPGNVALKLSAGMTFTASGDIRLVSTAAAVQTITSNGIAICSFFILSGSYQLTDNLSCNFFGAAGPDTFYTDNHDVTCTGFDNSAYPQLVPTDVVLGTSTLTITTSNGVYIDPPSTLSAASATLVFSDTSASDTNFYSGGKTFGTVRVVTGGSGKFIFNGSLTAAKLEATGGDAKTIQFLADETTTLTGGSDAFFSGSAGNLITLESTSPDTPWHLSKSSGTISSDYLSLEDSDAAGGATWYAGDNSTDVDGNSGWIFSGAGVDLVTDGSATFALTCGAIGVADIVGIGGASLSWTIAGTGLADVISSGSISLSFSTLAIGTVDAIGLGVSTISVSVLSIGTADIVGSGTAAISVNVTASGVTDVAGSGSSNSTFIGLAAGAADVTGSGIVEFTLLVSGARVAEDSSNGISVVSFASTAIGRADATASGLVRFSMTASARSATSGILIGTLFGSSRVKRPTRKKRDHKKRDIDIAITLMLGTR